MSPLVTENLRNAIIGPPTSPGIKGWLLVLCVVMTIFVPIQGATFLLEHVEYIRDITALENEDDIGLDEYIISMYVQTFFNVCFVAFSAYAGIMLCMKRPTAPTLAKIYFGCAILFSILSLVTIYLIHLPSEFEEELLRETKRITIIRLMAYGSWLTYLFRSKRIRATFPDTSQPGMAAG